MKEKTVGKKIIILGCPGCGKSTLAIRLAEKSDLPLYHLDNIWWRKDRSHISREEFDEKLQAIMKKEEWIIDGDYSRTYEERFLSCDTVIFLDYEQEECIKGVKERVGKRRVDIPWIAERLDPELLRLISFYHKENRPEVYRLITKYDDRQVLIFKTRQETDQWLESFDETAKTDFVG